VSTDLESTPLDSFPESSDASLILASDVSFEPIDNVALANLCGQFDENLKQIEKRLDVSISHRGNAFRVEGGAKNTRLALATLNHLYQQSQQMVLSPKQVQQSLQESNMNNLLAVNKDDAKSETLKIRRKVILTRGANQRQYIEKIRNQDINFGIGPAGTGKTYLAVASAVEALEKEEIRRIILVRPAVEAGEKLGFLPGDMAQKVDPYLRPLYDALYDMMGFEQVGKLIERNVIEVAPLAFMRGRTLNEAFVILDEAQNTTIEQMKMFLTRIGFGSTIIVTGDITQTDLPSHCKSGLQHVMHILKDIKNISFTFFDQKDVMRHPIVQQVIAAYEKKERTDT